MSIVLRLGALGLILFGMLIGGRQGIFFDMPSFVIFAGILTMSLVSWFKWADVRDAIRTGLGREPVNRGEVVRHVAVLRAARCVALGAGITGMFIGHVSILTNMDDPTSIGPAMAVSLLTSLYAVMLAELVFAPMINGLLVRASDS
jgi:flagellar motor component MotA